MPPSAQTTTRIASVRTSPTLSGSPVSSIPVTSWKPKTIAIPTRKSDSRYCPGCSSRSR